MRAPTAAAGRGAGRGSTPGCATSRKCASATGCTCSAGRPTTRTVSRRSRETAGWRLARPHPALRATLPRRRGASRARRRLRRRDARPACARSTGASSRRDRRARRRAAGSTCCRPGAISSPSIRAPCRRAPPGKSGGARRRRCWRATRRITANGRSGIVLDLWGSATMRTGGDDIAQAFALLGCRPTLGRRLQPRERLRDPAARACVGRPRVDVTLRISGPVPRRLPEPDRAVRRRRAGRRRARRERRGQSARREFGGAAPARVFGAAPGAYGVGLGAAHRRGRLGEPGASLARPISPRPAMPMTAKARAREARGGVPRAGSRRPTPSSMRRTCRGRTCSTPTPSRNMRAVSPPRRPKLGAKPALYHLDTTRPARRSVRSLAEEIARALRGRAANPRWIAGQMRHGHRGAAEIAADARQSVRLRRADRCGRAARSSISCSTRRSATTGARFPRRRQSAAPRGRWPTCSRRRGGAASGVAAQFVRENSRFDRGEAA